MYDQLSAQSHLQSYQSSSKEFNIMSGIDVVVVVFASVFVIFNINIVVIICAVIIVLIILIVILIIESKLR